MNYYDNNDMMNGFGNNGYGHGSWIFMFLMMLLVVALIIFLVRYFSRTNSTQETQEHAIELLKKRYAKGEIDKKQFEEIKKDISEK